LRHGGVPIPPIERYLQFLTLEQLGKGREEVLRLPEFVGKSLEEITTALKGIDDKFGDSLKRFHTIGDSMEETNKKLASVDGKLSGIDEKLDGISSLPDKIDALPERIAEAIGVKKKPSD